MEAKYLLAVLVGLAAAVAPSASGDPTHHEPQSVVAACAATSADVTWAPVDGANLLGYDVYEKAAGAPDYTKANTQIVTTTAYTVTGLTTGITYDFGVVAVYDDGPSGMSAPDSCTTG